MKKFILFIVCFSAYPTHAQEIFPTLNAQWWGGVAEGWPLTFYSYSGLSLNDSVVIDSVTYFKQAGFYEWSISDESLFCVRNDSTGKVFSRWYPLNFFNPDTSEQLLYDFSLIVGDTFIFKQLNPLIGYDTILSFLVIEADSVLCVGEMRKRIRLMNLTPSDWASEMTWIETIGCTLHPFYNIIGTFFEHTYCLESLLISNSSLYQDTCFEWWGIEQMSQSEAVLVIYPNPFTTTATISISREGEFDFILTDIFGREVFKSQILNSKSQIERGNLPSGIYFYQLKEEGRAIASGKVVIE